MAVPFRIDKKNKNNKKTKMRVIKAYKAMKMRNYAISQGAQKIVDSINEEMYSTDRDALAKSLKSLKENYPGDYEIIRKNDPGFIISIQRGMVRDNIAKEAHKLSGKISG